MAAMNHHAVDLSTQDPANYFQGTRQHPDNGLAPRRGDAFPEKSCCHETASAVRRRPSIMLNQEAKMR
jgi:hypothetical protein